MNSEKEIKESFCGACVAGIAALAGAGTAGSVSNSKNKKRKRIIFWTSVVISILSILIFIYLLCIKKCDECR